MKISEMTNDQATDALVRLSAPFENICNDEELVTALNDIKVMTHEPLIKVYGTMIPAFVRIGLKKHKHDLYEILSALSMTPVSKIGSMNFKETVNMLQDSYDDILRDFFTRTTIAKKIRAKK